jgi:hypothetical protein
MPIEDDYSSPELPFLNDALMEEGVLSSDTIPQTRLHWIAENLRITNKDSEIVPLEPNIGQLMLNNAINLQRSRNLPVRIVLLKPRQVGWSTWIEGDMFAEVYANKNIKGASISVDEDATNTLFEMTKLFYDELPPPKRGTVYSNRKEISFAKPHRSSIIAQTAGKTVLARSKNLRYVHTSEVAFWPNAAGQLAGLFQTVPYKPGTTIILESTANGIGGAFYDTFWAAVDRLRKNPEDLNGFIPVFFAWWQFPEYSTEIPPYITITPTDTETALITKYHLTKEQIYWRRLKIAEMNGDEGLFAQEYPSNAREAFQVTGRPVFSPTLLETLSRGTKPGRACLLKNNTLPGRDDIVELKDLGTLENPYLGEDCWRVWFLPKKGHQYAMGIDTMEGVVTDKKNDRSDVDYHGVVIYDRTDSVVAAQYHGRCDQHDLGVQCVLAGRLYGNAWVAIEIPNGKTVLDVFKHSNYPNLYQRQVHDFQVMEEDSDDYGWRTTTITRPWLVDGIIGVFRDGDIGIYSEDIIGEMRTFIRDKTGKPIHLPGEHDDLLFGLMIAIQVHTRCPLNALSYPGAYTDTSGTGKGGSIILGGGGLQNIAYPGATDNDDLLGAGSKNEEYTD